MTANPTVIIAGHGQMGHAMEALLADRAGLQLWDIAPDRLRPPAEVLATVARTEYLFLCVPTFAHAAVLDPLAALLAPGAAALSIAKGLDDSGRCAADILQAYLGTHPWGVLGGPMIANEIIAGRSGFAELGTTDAKLFVGVRDLFPAARLRITHAPAPRAVSWCGVLKNVYAPLIGVADGLGWGDNVRGHLVMESVAEIRRLLPELAGAEADAYGDAGLADFTTTVTSSSSHHYALGRRVAGGDYTALECEGVHSLRVMQAAKRVDARSYPLYAIAACLVNGPARLPPALHDWLTRG